jgi:hypothetical protein
MVHTQFPCTHFFKLALEIGQKAAVVAHTFNDSIWDLEAGRGFLFEFKTNLAYIIKQVPGQLGLYSETVYKRTKKKLDTVFASKCKRRC